MACHDRQPGADLQARSDGRSGSGELRAADPCPRRLLRAPHLREALEAPIQTEGWRVAASGEGASRHARWIGRSRNQSDANAVSAPDGLAIEMDFIIIARSDRRLEEHALITEAHAGREVSFGHDFAISVERVSVGAWRQCELACVCQIRAHDDRPDEEAMTGTRALSF